MDYAAALDVTLSTIAKEFRVPKEQLSEATTASDVDGWDSFSHGMLIMAIEDQIGAALPLDRMLEAENVGTLAALVAEASA